MRRTNLMHDRWITALAAIAAGLAAVLLAGGLAAPAAGATNLYAAQAANTAGGPGEQVSQFAVAAGGALTELAPAALGANARDIAITPDGRFAYVTRSAGAAGAGPGAIAQFARGANGLLTPIGAPATAGSEPQGILVNPQGTRVVYVDAVAATVTSHPIAADGTLGAALVVAAGSARPRHVATNPAGTSLYVAVAGTPTQPAPGIRQFDVDPATGALTPKAVAFVPWPTGAPVPPADVARMNVSPDGRHLYAASGQGASGIAHFPIDVTGTLAGGSLVGVSGSDQTGATPISPGGNFLWAPTNAPRLGRIDQFAIDATGGLSPLSPASVPYPVPADLPARDATASPDGRTLYLGQDANVGSWTIAPNGTLSVLDNDPSTAAAVTGAGIAVAPSQAPVAAFTAAAQPAGLATAFDGRASSDPDGAIVRFDWDFGDGTGLADGGPTVAHVYATPGVRTVTLTVTDADGTSTSKLWTGTQILRNGGPSAQTTRAVTIPAAVVPPPPPPPPAAPRPDKGKSVTIAATGGRVRVKLPGSRRYVDVRQLREIPLGSTIDARKGLVRVTAEVDASTRRTQSSIFYDGIFTVLQTKGSKPILTAKLAGGSFAGCTPRRRASTHAIAPGARAGLVRAAAKKRSKRRVRRLWGDGKGDFRTTGKRSSATVRGTRWLVEDRCDGTLTRVRSGIVDVRDTRLKKTIRLRAGKRSQYLAKAP